MKTNTRDKILEVAHRLIMVQGFNNTGIGQILQEAGVPKGSFYHYFASKDELGYALIDNYCNMILWYLDEHFQNHQGPTLAAMRLYFEKAAGMFQQEFSLCNCMLGNLGQELAAQHDGFRQLLRERFVAVEQRLTQAFERAKSEGDLAPDANSEQLARILFFAWEGGLMRAKLEQSADDLEHLVAHFFDSLPRPRTQ